VNHLYRALVRRASLPGLVFLLTVAGPAKASLWQNVNPAPESSTLLLLAIGALIVGGATAKRSDCSVIARRRDSGEIRRRRLVHFVGRGRP